MGTEFRWLKKMLDSLHRVTNAENGPCFISRTKAESSIVRDVPFISGDMTAQWNGRSSSASMRSNACSPICFLMKPGSLELLILIEH